MPYALGIDVGSTGTKVVLAEVGDDVREVRRAVRPTPPDAPALLDAVVDAVRETLVEGPAPDVVGVASMAETGVALDADDAPLTPLVRWDGAGSGAEAEHLARVLGRDALFAATGVRASGKVPLATLARLRAAGVPLVRWAGVADLVVLALTGELVTDHTLAGRSMAYRVDGVGLPSAFDAALLGHVGLRPSALARVAGPREVAGRVRSAARRFVEAGVPAGVPVVVAGHDHAVGTWAAGARSPGARADSVGTAEAVTTVLAGAPTPPPVAAAGMSWVRTPTGHHALQAGSSSSGALLAWWARERGRTVPDLLADARDVPGPTGVLVQPWLHGRQCPLPDARAQAVVPAGHPEPVLTRAVVEALCLQARWMLEEQARLGGVRADAPAVVLGGALVADPVVAAVKGAVHPHRLDRVTVGEPVATGAAVLAAARAGLLGAGRAGGLGAGRAGGLGADRAGVHDHEDPLVGAPVLPTAPLVAPVAARLAAPVAGRPGDASSDPYGAALDALVAAALRRS